MNDKVEYVREHLKNLNYLCSIEIKILCRDITPNDIKVYILPFNSFISIKYHLHKYEKDFIKTVKKYSDLIESNQELDAEANKLRELLDSSIEYVDKLIQMETIILECTYNLNKLC